MRCLVLVMFLSLTLNLFAAEFEIFTLSKATVDETNATVYYIDQGDQLLESINQTMLAKGVRNEEQGKPYAAQELKHALANQVKGLLKAGRYQLKYFPAIVVDGQYVIYGTTDIDAYEELKP